MTTTRVLFVAFLALLGACAHDDCGTERPTTIERGGIALRPEAAVEDFPPPLELAEPPAPPWGDLDWRREGEVIIAGLEGDEPELLAARGAFVGGMLLRRTRGLGELAVAAHESGTNGRRLEISGDELALAAAGKLLDGLKESREMLGFVFSLVAADTDETLVGPMSLTVLAGQTASISIINEIAYVKDFDVEIASAAVIADPIIDILREGVVVTIRPYADPDGRIEMDGEVMSSAVARPINEFTTNLGDGSDVTLQIPELKTTTRRASIVVPVDQVDFVIEDIEMLAPDGDGGFSSTRARLIGSIRR